ncbi:MAG: mannosyltransferase [Sphingobacteriales bacterium 40-81]|nr:MAG: mannosyltransferase [Sphingobacteriales bacterium 40-81]
MNRHLHIVCLDVPYPPDYGGVYDLFYKIKCLKEEGIFIHLHCFEYGRGEQTILNQYCESVHYYKRKKGIAAFSLELPYIVSSRNDKALKQNLEKDNYPVLLEGIHCTYLLYRNGLQNRKVILRAHNIEFEYYRQLAQKERSFFKQAYYVNETRLLREYEPKVAKKADLTLTVSANDAKIYKTLFGVTNAQYLPVFIPWNEVTAAAGTGAYCLYHGNLSVNENQAAALWLIEKVFSSLNIPLIIAGKNPSSSIIAAADKYDHITIIANPPASQMEELIKNAQANVLPSFSNTGIKLKLLHALFCGRHCIVNNMMVAGTGLEDICLVAENENELIGNIKTFFTQPFTNEDISKRTYLLQQLYNNRQNVKHLMNMVNGRVQ